MLNQKTTFFKPIRWFQSLAAVVILQAIPPTHFAAAQEPIVLFDPSSFSIEEIQTKHTRINRIDGNPAGLQVTTQPNEDYPSIYLKTPAETQDFSKMPVVELTVRNDCDHDVDVMLVLENEQCNGREGCSADKLHVQQGQVAVMRLVVGRWYGSESLAFDPQRITRWRVLVDRSSQTHQFSVLSLRGISLDNEVQDIYESDYFATLQPFFGKGLNIGNTLEAPNEGEWGGTLKDEHLKIIRDAGFDSIRLPVRWSAHASGRSPYQLDASFKKRVEHVIDLALQNQLRVVLNIHHYEEIIEKPQAHRDRFLGLWRQIAPAFADYPNGLAFELFNEPHGKMDAEFWNQLAAEAVEVIRETNPDRWIVIGPVDWNSVRGLSKLKLPQDKHRIAMTFHYYSPMEVTHQGAPWLDNDAKKWIGTTWTNSLVERTELQLNFNQALRFGYENKVPIYLGEFGTYQNAPWESRVTWTTAIVREAARRKMGYAYWEFYSGFGIYDPEKETWRAELQQAVLGTEQPD